MSRIVSFLSVQAPYRLILPKTATRTGPCSPSSPLESQQGKPISITRLPRQPQNLKSNAVPRGFSSSFRDWAVEENNHPREVVEAALMPVVANQTEAAHAQSDRFERRRQQMREWAEHLSEVCGRVNSLHQ